ncbi:Methyl-accepting chemotaxis protein PctB [Marinomonas aquimarina]|uniref:Methyl-accepting chemotaxis protein PctB n=1 Tax=Marinomonas aquimarina TaxID=295068 RepID=A0A1A8T765_9GAMM|nr:methyl-accepting chemotaxis protein [Marinomonas aquimarina]SBS26975.1 Methyl-accepting chemotaxis protein PctB [Marinomonas aquimarina]
MQIKQKLMLNTCVAIAAMVALIVSFLVAENRLEELIRGKEQAQRQESEMLLLRRHEKDFLAREDIKYVQRFDEVMQRITQQQDSLNQLFIDSGINHQTFSGLRPLFQDYDRKFQELVQAKQTMGLTQDEGLEGQLRGAVHDIESALKQLDQPSILVTMLQLRRHEKDFMLRLDTKYPERFRGTLQQLKQQIQSANIASSEQTRLLRLADTYQTKFSAYVNQQRLVGLSSDQGLMGEMRRTIQQTEDMLKAMDQSMTRQTDLLLREIEITMAMVFILVALVASLIAWRISASINRPLALIRDAMLKIDSSRDLSLRVQYNANDEIGDVARSMNQMLEGFQAVVGSVNDTVQQMNQQTLQLSQTAERTANDADRQRDETDMVAASVAQLVGTIEDISHNMSVAVDKTQSTEQSATDGQTRVSSAVSRVHKLSSRLEGAMGSAEELAKQSQSIGSMLSVIQDIAEQTNLLALNAAIEAARAGEQGRGFAVVADEVRALASRTQDATLEISEIIESLQNRSQSIVSIMKECTEDGLRSSEESAVIGEVLGRITQEVHDIADMARSVATAIEQQSTAANEINRNVVTIREITMDTSEAVRLNSQSSHEISEQAHQLESVVSRFKL